MKADILLADICLLAGQDIVPDCCLAIRGNAILQAGPSAEFSGIEAGTVLEGHGQLALPGLVNGHCHAAMTLFRGMSDDLRLFDWLHEHIFPAEAAHVSSEMVYWCSKLAAAEMMLAGTTTVADGYFCEDAAAQAFAEAGMRMVAAQGVIDFPAPGVPDPRRNIKAATAFVDRWQQHPLVSPAVFAHSPYACSPDTLRAAKALARDKEVPWFIHVAETRSEPGMIANMQGGSPIRHLRALDVLDSATICVHCVWADEEDVAMLAETGAGAVFCPQSNLKLASGMPPVHAMLAKGVHAGLGTDGAASSNGLDMFREARVCADISGLSWPAVLNMAAAGGASVLGLEDVGVLLPGKKADVVLIRPDACRRSSLISTISLPFCASDVQTVLINGRMVVQDRRILSFDAEEAMQQVRCLARRVHGSAHVC